MPWKTYSLIAAATVATASASLADGYSDHRGVTLFTTQPCQAAVDTIDAQNTPFEPDTASFETLQKDVKAMVERMSLAGMAWGFILGYDTAQGGLHDGNATTLMRFKDACKAAPDKTGIAILEGLA